MSIKTPDDIREGAVFGRKLSELALPLYKTERREQGAALIAAALFDDDECYALVHPRDWKTRPSKSEEKAQKRVKSSIARTVQRHLDLENAYDVSSNYMMAYSILFNCSLDFLYGKIDVPCPNVEILDISNKTGLSVNAVKNLVNSADATEGGPSFVHKSWTRLLEGDAFLGIPLDIVAAYNEACEVLKGDAAVEAIEAALKDKDPTTIAYNIIDIKKKPIQKTREGHYAAYYGMLYKLAQNVTGLLDTLVEDQLTEEHYYEGAVKDLTRQYRNEYYARNGEPEKIERPADGEFHFNTHFMI